MVAFDFITQKDLRASLEADFKEMTSCLETGCWKAVHVLAGSMIEALLVDYLLASNMPNGAQDPLAMALADLISVCRKQKIISQKAADLCNVVKHYRNLIHPGRSVRLNEKIDEPGAKIALSLVEIIVTEISKARSESYGYTAEQIVAKIKRDPSVIAILKHILKGTNELELERLLQEVLPQAYLDHALSVHDVPFEPEDRILPALEICFRQALSLVSNEVEKTVIKKFISILKEGDGFTVNMYGAAFFKAIDLQHLSDEERTVVKEHLFSRLKEEVSSPHLQMLEGIGMFIREEGIEEFVDPLIRAVIWGAPDSLRNEAESRIENEYSLTNEIVSNRLIHRLNNWITHFEHRAQTAFATKIRDLRSKIELKGDDIPF
jgi:hypothetical protein